LDELSDDDLILMYAQGDADAFDVLFDRHHTSVYNFARLMLDGPEGAEEIMQEAFLAVARAAKRYEPRSRFRPWLMRIVRNLCLNRLQTERGRRRILAEGAMEGIELISREPAAPARIERDEDMAALQSAVRRLPERQREAIVLYAFEQMSYQEIGQVLGVPINTVKSLIHRARANLAGGLAQDTEGKTDGV
jgi:RNA polymerase sigma-70 factor (ECF subfamily)